MLAQALLVLAVTFAALWFYVRATAPEPGTCRVLHVYDGDTVALDCGAGEMTARIEGLDAPETRDARCPAERALGDRATARLRALIGSARAVAVRQDGTDRYGRALVRLWLDGRDPAQVLVAEGLADAYLGGPRRNWCALGARLP